jgi:hypothetical protein
MERKSCTFATKKGCGTQRYYLLDASNSALFLQVLRTKMTGANQGDREEVNSRHISKTNPLNG